MEPRERLIFPLPVSSPSGNKLQRVAAGITEDWLKGSRQAGTWHSSPLSHWGNQEFHRLRHLHIHHHARLCFWVQTLNCPLMLDVTMWPILVSGVWEKELGVTCGWRHLTFRVWLSSWLFPRSVLGGCTFWEGLLYWLRWSRICLQCRRPGFDPCFGKIPWKREWLPTPVFLPGEFHGQRLQSMWLQRDKHDWVTMMLEKTLESPLDSKEIKPVNPKGNQSWIFIGRTVDKAEALILWPPDVKSWLMGKTLILGKIKGRRRRGQQRTGWFDGIIESMDMSGASSGKWWRTGKPDVLQSMGLQRVRYDLVTEQHTVIHPKLICWNLIPRVLGGGALFKSWG